MARTGKLLELSREHHTALVLARDCRRVEAKDVEALLTRIRQHHDEILVGHFAVEELLIDSLGDAIPADLASRFHADHAWLREWMTVPTHGIEAIQAYGDRLNAHIRFEERELWPVLQPIAG